MDKSKRKNYSFHKSYNNKKSRQYCLEAGMTGFLCTCNFQEKKCVSDAYKILEEFANEIYGSDTKATKDQVKVEEPSNEVKSVTQKEGSDDEDISDALNKEIAELKAATDKPRTAKRFQHVDAGVKNVIFIRTTLLDPLEIALAIIKRLSETKQQKTRFLLRLIPIQIVCKANMTDIKNTADKVFEKYFAQEPKTFSIVFNRHCNDQIQRQEIIEELASLVLKKNPGNKANLSSPEIAVVVEIIRGFCLLSIAPDYFKYKKYNLLELCSVKPEEPEKKTVPDESNEKKISDESMTQGVESRTPEVIAKEVHDVQKNELTIGTTDPATSKVADMPESALPNTESA